MISDRSAQPKTLLVVPTYNNALSLEGVLASLLAYSPDILVVNDGSTDLTKEIIAKFLPAVQYQEHTENRGKGQAIITAFNYAKTHSYDTILTFDADGQHRSEDLPQFMAAIASHPRALVIGVRDMHAASAGHVPGSSLFGRSFSNFWVKLETGLSLSDTQSGLRAYPVADSIFMGRRDSRYSFEIEVLVHAIWQNYEVHEIPMTVYYPPREERVSHFDPWWDNLRLSLLHSRLVTMHVLSLLTWGLAFPRTIRPPASANERRGSHLLAFFMKWAGPWGCYVLAVFPLLFYYLSDRRSRQGIASLYRQIGRGNRPGFWRGFANFWYFGLTLIDRLTYTRRLDGLKGTISFHQQHTMVPRGSILVGAHYGDWILCGLGFSRFYKLKMALVVNESLNPQFMNLINRVAKEHIKIVDASRAHPGTLLQLKEYLEQGYCLGFMADRAEHPKHQVRLNFLGEPAPFSSLPFRMAAIVKAPTYIFSCKKMGSRPSSPYELLIKKLADGEEGLSTEALAQRYVSELERIVREEPQHWFNFSSPWEGPQQALASSENRAVGLT